MTLNDVDKFIGQQAAVWPLVAQNYNALKNIEIRRFDFDGFTIVAQHNPARITSSGANVDSKAIAERPCFLCSKNRPKEQIAIDWSGYEILVNPFPIFGRHLTIAKKEHVPQQLSQHACCEYVADMFRLACELNGMAVFYNGARCGASAPDHLHFQAGDASKWPVFNDFKPTMQLKQYARTEVSVCSTIGRKVIRIITDQSQAAQAEVREVLDSHNINDSMVNIVARQAGDGLVEFYVIPRRAFRPWQYSAAADEQLLISPASVEVGGIFIVPQKKHFEKLQAADIEDILKQVCF
ncbi:MAG: DUF4922 domain-containing protein [Bacteroidales bacterium]|nr:DUF4922 domain-containing protein [Bacteroidales bacterium]